MKHFLLHWFLTAIALAITAWILPGVRMTSTGALLFAALILGLVNAAVRPVLVLMTLPITVLTLGLFYLVVNGIAFALAAGLSPGFNVDGFGWAILGALVLSIVSWAIDALVPG